jgi:hypothetical protein
METFPSKGAEMVRIGKKVWLRFFLGLSVALAGIQISETAFASDFYASPAKQSANDADVGIDGPGNSIFTWTAFTTQGIVAQLRKRSATGVLAAPQTLSKTGHDAVRPHVAVNGAGAAVAVWQINHGDASAKTQYRTNSSGSTGIS